MAALLVALSLMAVAMTVVMPVWKQMAQREKEAELVFRGQQYVRALGLFQRKTGPTLPPNVDVLVEQHFLRKKFKDPITGQDFLLIPAAMGTAQPGVQLQGLGGAGSATGLPTASGAQTSPYVAQGGPFGTTVPGGVIGVVSKSTDTSIRQYNGRGHYNEWEFRYTAPPPPAQQGGPAGGGRGVGAGQGPGGVPAGGRGPGERGRGGPGGLPEGRGRGLELQPPPGGRGPGGAPPGGAGGIGRGAAPIGR